jgi:hypothetical protein
MGCIVGRHVAGESVAGSHNLIHGTVGVRHDGSEDGPLSGSIEGLITVEETHDGWGGGVDSVLA